MRLPPIRLSGGHSVASDGGAIYLGDKTSAVLRNCTISACQSGHSSGAVDATNASLLLQETTVAECTSLASTSSTDTAAIRVSDVLGTLSCDRLTLCDVQSLGDVILITGGANATIVSSEVFNIGLNGAGSNWHSLLSATSVGGLSTVVIADSAFRNVTTVTGSNSNGISSRSRCRVTVFQCSFQFISASRGAAGYVLSNSADAFLSFIGCSFTDLRSVRYLGGVFYIEGGNLAVTGCLIERCESAREGGVLAARFLGVASVENTTMRDCHAHGSYSPKGGALYAIHFSTLHVTNCTIEQCTAVLDIDSASFTGIADFSSPSYGGGAVYIEEDSIVTWTGGRVSECLATNGAGGALAVKARCSLTVTGASFHDCSSTGSGGAIFAQGHENLRIETSVFSGCVTGQGGGAVVSPVAFEHDD